jgi:hypothetical protein
VIFTPSSLFHTGLRFEEISGAEVWHGDVRVFSVFDLSSGELLGYFYLDMYTRFGFTSSFFLFLFFFLTFSVLDLFLIYLFEFERHGHMLYTWTGKENMVIPVLWLFKTVHYH